MTARDRSAPRAVAQPRSLRRILLAAVPLLFGLWYFVGLAPYGLHVGEDGDVLYEAFATYRGQLPYVDFSTGYTPAYFFWHAALFHVFGVDALVLRIAAALANALTLWLLYLLAARIVRPGIALVPPLALAASLPIYPGEFCSFNVPYPAWYNVTFWLASMLALAVYAHRERLLYVAVAGIVAGLSFAFKPNVGLFNIAALSVFVLWWHAPGAHATRFERAAWWMIAVTTIAGVFAVFGLDVFSRRFILFPLPFLVAAGVLLVHARLVGGRPRFVPAAVALFVAFALPNVPWMVYFLRTLGVRGFLHDVLLIGSSYEPFFFIAYRPLLARWDVGVLIAVAALYLLPLAIRHGRLPLWAPFAAAASATALAVAYVLVLAPMRFGFHTALVTRLNDLAFFLVPLVTWTGVALLTLRIVRAPRERGHVAVFALFVICAPALALGMHPRSDFMHLLISAPAAMLVGAVLLDELVTHWHAAVAERRAWRWAVSTALTVPILLLGGDLLAPGVILAARLYAHYTGVDHRPWARLDLPHATVVREPGNDREFTTLHAVARYLDEHTTANDYVFPFPNLSLLCFLSGRLNPTAKGYFIAGYPDHYTEAEIVSGLRDRTPAMVVSLAEHQIFVLTAPAYYFLIREYARQRFEPVAQIGPYVAMARRANGLPGDRRDPGRALERIDVSRPAATWDALDDPDPLVQRRAAREIEHARDPGGAVALARRAVSRKAANRVLFLQIAEQFADERAIPAFVQIAARDYATEAGQIAADALYFTVEKSLTEHFWLGADGQSERLKELRAELGVEPFRTWLRGRRTDGRLRYAAAWALGILHDDDAVPFLEKTLESGDRDLTLVASFSLIALGRAADVADDLVAALDDDDIYAPSLLIEAYRHDPAAARAAIAVGADTGSAKARAMLSWIIAAIQDPNLAPTLATLTDDVDGGVREAATWSAAWLTGDGAITSSWSRP